MGIERVGRDVLVSIFQGGGVARGGAARAARSTARLLATRVLGALRHGCEARPPGDSLGDSRPARPPPPSGSRPRLPFAPRRPLGGAGDGRHRAHRATSPSCSRPTRSSGRPRPRPPRRLRRSCAPTSSRCSSAASCASPSAITPASCPTCFVFPLAEQLAALALEAVEAWTRGRPYYRRVAAFGAICGVKLGSEGRRVAHARRGAPRARRRAPRPGPSPPSTWARSAQGVVAFGRALVRSLCRRDRAQASNLRLHAFRGRVRELSERLRDATRDDSRINDAPERYRAFAASVRPAANAERPRFGRARLRFTARWLGGRPLDRPALHLPLRRPRRGRRHARAPLPRRADRRAALAPALRAAPSR